MTLKRSNSESPGLAPWAGAVESLRDWLTRCHSTQTTKPLETDCSL